MPISVQNITATSATVNWPSAPGCLDTFYSIMYHPNWNSLLMGYTRKSFLREDRVPITQATTFLGNLSPQTTYVLCVTCQSANPVREQCQVFNTLDEGPEADGGRRDLAMGVWLASSLLLLVIAVVLLWGCLHSMCPGHEQGEPGDGGSCPTMCSPRQVQTLVPGGAGGGGGGGGGGGRGGTGEEGRPRDSSFSTPSCSEEEEDEEEDDDKEEEEGDLQQATVAENPFGVKCGEKGSAEPQGHELGGLSTQSNGNTN